MFYDASFINNIYIDKKRYVLQNNFCYKKKVRFDINS